jgi:hypothetical protein
VSVAHDYVRERVLVKERERDRARIGSVAHGCEGERGLAKERERERERG